MVERVNRIFEERIKCMLFNAKLPKSFWDEVMTIVIDLINLSHLSPRDGDIPNRVWNGKYVSYEPLRVFGCIACVYILKMKDPNFMTNEYIFLGYSNEEFVCRL